MARRWPDLKAECDSLPHMLLPWLFKRSQRAVFEVTAKKKTRKRKEGGGGAATVSGDGMTRSRFCHPQRGGSMIEDLLKGKILRCATSLLATLLRPFAPSAAVRDATPPPQRGEVQVAQHPTSLGSFPFPGAF